MLRLIDFYRFYSCRPQKGLEYRVNHGFRVLGE